MKTRSLVIMAPLLLGLLTVGIVSKILASQSGRPAPSGNVALPAQQPKKPVSQQWEYRIISSYAIPQPSFGGDMTAALLKQLERQMNDLASQGFEVVSLNPVSGEGGPRLSRAIPQGGYSDEAPFSAHPQVIVLLRRLRE